MVAIVGAGPIGLSAITGARLFSPSHVVAIDLADTRLEAAKQFGADIIVNNSRQDPLETIRALTDGLGANVAIEAVGVPATFELAAQMVRPGGHIANIGVHGEPATLHLEELWIKNITITTYCLIHSLGTDASFERRDRSAAQTFAATAKAPGVQRNVYLGGIISRQAGNCPRTFAPAPGSATSCWPAACRPPRCRPR